MYGYETERRAVCTRSLHTHHMLSLCSLRSHHSTLARLAARKRFNARLACSARFARRLASADLRSRFARACRLAYLLRSPCRLLGRFARRHTSSFPTSLRSLCLPPRPDPRWAVHAPERSARHLTSSTHTRLQRTPAARTLARCQCHTSSFLTSLVSLAYSAARFASALSAYWLLVGAACSPRRLACCSLRSPLALLACCSPRSLCSPVECCSFCSTHLLGSPGRGSRAPRTGEM